MGWRADSTAVTADSMLYTSDGGPSYANLVTPVPSNIVITPKNLTLEYSGVNLSKINGVTI